MIHLFTGTPGAGKTAGAIDYILTEEVFKNRPVYAHNVNGLNIPQWTEIDKDTAVNWFELPSGSVVFVDECQDIWRPRKTGSDVPETVQRLEKHRHMGIDFVLTCQFPRQIDIVVRRLVGVHHHLYRPFGMKHSTRYTYQKCEDQPEDFHAKKTAVTSRVKPNPKVFGLYKSTELDTHKTKLPKKFLIFPILLIALVLSIYFVYSMINSLGRSDADTQPQSNATETTRIFPSNPVPVQPINTTDSLRSYLQQRVPLVDNDPASAPIFTEVREVRSYPRPQCIASLTGQLPIRAKEQPCVCYSQQATKLDIDYKTCLHYVKSGFDFDPTYPDPAFDEDREENHTGLARSPTLPASAFQPPSPFTDSRASQRPSQVGQSGQLSRCGSIFGSIDAKQRSKAVVVPSL